MQRSPIARVVWACTAALVVTLAAPLPLSSQSQEQVTICHRTGSSTAPWVLMIIDARLWPEYEAQGDKRAASLADCAQAAPAPAAPMQAAPGAPPASALQQQPVAQTNTPVPTPIVALPTAVPTPAPTAAATAAPRVETAGVAVAQGAATPEVSNLPKSGEPDRPLLVLGLLAIALAGLLLRRLARGTS